MEESVFPLPAVAEELKKNFIEARLHTDNEERLSPATYKRNKEVQKEMVNSEANPYFVVFDPKTGKVLRKKAGMLFEKRFLELLRGGGRN